MNREFSYIDAIEMSTYFENYDGNENNDFHLSQKFKDKLKKALGPIAAVGGAVGLGIAFGPALLGAVGPMLPAIKGYLIKQGVNVKGMGPGEKLKTFYEKVFKDKANTTDKDGPKKVVEKIIKFFKDLKEKKASGQLGPLESALVDTAEKTISDISAGKADVADIVNDGVTTDTGSKGKSKEGVEVTTKIDTKTILIAVAALVALMYFSKK
jgi:hypothetical protein